MICKLAKKRKKKASEFICKHCSFQKILSITGQHYTHSIQLTRFQGYTGLEKEKKEPNTGMVRNDISEGANHKTQNLRVFGTEIQHSILSLTHSSPFLRILL